MGLKFGFILLFYVINLTDCEKTPFTLDDLVVPSSALESTDAVWLSDRLLVYEKNDQLLSLNINQDAIAKSVLIDNETFKHYTPLKWKVSPSTNFVALTTDKKELTRHRVLEKVTVLNVKKNTETIVKANAVNEWILLLIWNHGSGSDDFAFVVDNDIYYMNANRDPNPLRITFSGSTDIYNGVPDWMYEEEILQTNVAMWWSDDGQSLAFLSFNNTLVRKYPLEFYDEKDKYPRVEQLPYPKVNEVIPTVTLYVWNRTLNKIFELKPPKEVSDLREFYVYSVTWFNNESLIVIWSNRIQNVAFYSTCTVKNYACKTHHLQTFYGIWINPDNMIIRFVTDDKYFILLPKYETDRYRYWHVAIISANADKSQPVFLTKGLWEVESIVGYNKERELLYFIAARPTPRRRNLYSISTKTPSLKEPNCESCWMSQFLCNTVTARFAQYGRYYLLSCQVLTLENNTDYSDYLLTKALPIINHMTLPMQNGYDAFVKLMLPPNFKPNNKRPIPLVLKVYGGPDSQAANEVFSISYETHLVTQKGYAVAYVDARGSSDCGSKYTEPVYKRLGNVEIDDQISAVKLLLNSSDFLDPDNTVVWGWSYGGYSTLRIVEKDEFGTFKCAMAVAPVTDLRLYDAAYTERYMGLDRVNDNAEGYKNANALTNFEAFKKGKFLLAHGTADDNVHFQQTALLVEQLEKINVQFQYMMYTNQKHSISKRRLHLYTMMDKFLDDCLEFYIE